MPRQNESTYLSHPAHIIYHEYCGHILRRVLKPDPADKTQTGCICDMPPEEIWQTKRVERGEATCEIDELMYEARSLPAECNACLEDRMGGGHHATSESESDHGKITSTSSKRVMKSGLRRKASSPKILRVKKKPRCSAVKATPTTRLARELERLGIDSESLASSSGSDSSRRGKKRGRKPKVQSLVVGETIEEQIWKHLRSGPVKNL
ncbi:hypothetical protein TWF694_001725 [Orbilia ellipsospora]|uniref:Uncharacterized protein n=1 Tax=Orbilia ellipsospora TaxID=2528407 RepID=A0AAV9X3E6_9PEZI